MPSHKQMIASMLSGGAVRTRANKQKEEAKTKKEEALEKRRRMAKQTKRFKDMALRLKKRASGSLAHKVASKLVKTDGSLSKEGRRVIKSLRKVRSAQGMVSAYMNLRKRHDSGKAHLHGRRKKRAKRRSKKKNSKGKTVMETISYTRKNKSGKTVTVSYKRPKRTGSLKLHKKKRRRRYTASQARQVYLRKQGKKYGSVRRFKTSLHRTSGEKKRPTRSAARRSKRKKTEYSTSLYKSDRIYMFGKNKKKVAAWRASTDKLKRAKKAEFTEQQRKQISKFARSVENEMKRRAKLRYTKTQKAAARRTRESNHALIKSAKALIQKARRAKKSQTRRRQKIIKDMNKMVREMKGKCVDSKDCKGKKVCDKETKKCRKSKKKKKMSLKKRCASAKCKSGKLKNPRKGRCCKKKGKKKGKKKAPRKGRGAMVAQGKGTGKGQKLTLTDRELRYRARTARKPK